MKFTLLIAALLLAACQNDTVPDEAPLPINSELLEQLDSTAPNFETELADLTVQVVGLSAPADALSPEEAAELISDYLRNMIGFNISGSHMTLEYSDSIRSARTFWFASISQDDGSESYYVTIDAQTGEPIDLMNLSFPPLRPDDEQFTWGEDDWDEWLASIDLFPEPSEEEVVFYATLAMHFANRHFEHTAVIDLIPGHEGEFFDPINGFISFEAIDETGRTAEIAIQTQTGYLGIFGTGHNDTIPEF